MGYRSILFFPKSLALSYNLYRPICVFFNGEEGGGFFFNFKKVSDLRKKTIYETTGYKVRLYHHLDLYNTSTYVIFFS